jgi:hypothetical protein
MVLDIYDSRIVANTPPLHVNCRSVWSPATYYSHPQGAILDENYIQAMEDHPGIQRDKDIEEVRTLIEALQREEASIEPQQRLKFPWSEDGQETIRPEAPQNVTAPIEDFNLAEDAEVWMHHTYEGVEFDFRGMRKENITQLVSRHVELANKYPDLMGNLGYIGGYQGDNTPAALQNLPSDWWGDDTLANLPSLTPGQEYEVIDGGEFWAKGKKPIPGLFKPQIEFDAIGLNPKLWNNRNADDKVLQAAQNGQIVSVAKNVGDLYLHEVGHLVDAYLERTLGDEYRKWRDENIIDMKGLSEYANNSNQEAVAEAFVEGYLASNTRVGRELIALLKKAASKSAKIGRV